MKFKPLVHKLAIALCLLFLWSHAIAADIRPQLPTDVIMNKGAGQGNWLIIKIRLGSGEELPFVVDTGCPKTILDKSLEPKLGNRLGAETIWTLSSKWKTHIYAVPALYLESTRLLTSSNILTCDFEQMAAFKNHSIKGILGMDCLRHYCIQLDFDAQKICFLNPDHLNAAELGKPYPLKFSKEQEDSGSGIQPFIQHAGLLGGTNMHSVIDTGMNMDGSVGKNEIKRHASGSYSGGILTRFKHCLAVKGLVKGVSVSIPKCVWDGNTYTNIAVGRAPSDSPNWIGLKFLARHLVTLDFPNGMMYLKMKSSGPLADENAAAEQPNQSHN